MTLSNRKAKVTILLATRNGARFLPAQLQSYVEQSHGNWELIGSDDGSTDNTVAILDQFARSNPQRVVVRPGPQLGFWQNFVSLVRTHDIDGDFIAYSDQDDVWFAAKLTAAVDWLQTVETAVPALYFTRTELVDVNGVLVGLSPLFERPPSFQNALVQNIGGGNTMVFNRAALDVLRSTPNAELVSHDWWTYQVITGVGGIVRYDPKPGVKYRQHGQNLVGSNIGLRARLVRMAALMNGRVVMWNETNIAMLSEMRGLLTPANRATLDDFVRARSSWFGKRLYLLRTSGVYRQSTIENAGMFLGSMLGRL